MQTEPPKADPPRRNRRYFQFRPESAEHDDSATKKGVPPWHAFS
jgi:hypothetical protein